MRSRNLSIRPLFAAANVLLLGLISITALPSTLAADLPIIDLGYVQQQATNETDEYYAFYNIRFAAPPLGDLRFRNPQPPLDEPDVQNGVYGRDTFCAQPVDIGSEELIGDEDCLFLDVFMPKNISYEAKVPVLAWWYGGSYVSGMKGDTDISGLFKQAAEPFIFVASNYRLGVFGWSAPSNEDVDINAGLHDVRFAMEWIGEYIDKFGGDPDNVTVIGESAGGGVVLHTLVANGGDGPELPFRQAIIQSPGWFPETNTNGRDSTWATFENYTNCTDVECLRDAPTAILQAANAYTIGQVFSIFAGSLPQGSFWAFAPLPDGDYLPEAAPKLLSEGRFHTEVESVILSSTRWEFEGSLFDVSCEEPTYTKTTTAILYVLLNGNLANALEAAKLYPATGSGNDTCSFAPIINDIGFHCNGYWTASAFSRREPQNKARRYMFNISNATHGMDVAYNFYSPSKPSPSIDPNIAAQHQRWLANYTLFGDAGLPSWPLWENTTAQTLWLNATGLAVGDDLFAWDVNRERCDVLYEVLYGA